MKSDDVGSATERELERILLHLRRTIRARGFSQVRIEQALDWGPGYVSRLLTRRKPLRWDQLLAILIVIDVEPGEFFHRLPRR